MSSLMKRVVAEEIKSARKANGLDQKELAEKLGVKQQRISEIESGNHSAGIETLAKIADALGMSLRVFFEEEDLDRLADNYHAPRDFVFPVALLKQLEKQARRESKSTNEYVIEALSRQVKEDSREFYRPFFIEIPEGNFIDVEDLGWKKIA